MKDKKYFVLRLLCIVFGLLGAVLNIVNILNG